MSDLSIENLQQLVKSLIFPFYTLERDAPLTFRTTRNENDAEHSWSLALFACALAPQIDPTLDVGRVCQFATVHDLVEVYAGDTSNFAPEAEKATKENREHEALRTLRREFQAFPWITETIETYERQDSPEARYVKAVDKMLLLLFDYVEDGFFYKERQVTLRSWKITMARHRDKAKVDPRVYVYYDKIWRLLISHPEFFYSSDSTRT